MAKANRGKPPNAARETDDAHAPKSGQRTRFGAARRASAQATAHAKPRATDAGAPANAAARPPRRDGGAQSASVRHIDTAGYTGPQAPPIVAPSWRRRIVVERAADLAALARELEHAHVVALDAEFAQPRVRAQNEPPHRLAVLQLAFDDEYRASYVVDALRLADLSPLRAILANPAILKVFHGIGADSRVLATRDLVARNTLDIEAVSRSLFGQHESGLQRMLQRAANVRLDKSFQRADWARRPLTTAMVAYAARDAEMTYALYGWLTANYPAMMALQHVAADEPEPGAAAWIAPYLEGSRPKPAALAIAEAGIEADVAAQERDLRAALIAVRHPPQRARVMRLIADLDLRALAEDLRIFLNAPAAEERSAAARTIGRLGDRSAILLLRPLLEDSVQDVRQAAQVALEHLEHPSWRPPARPRMPASGRGHSGDVRWSSDDASGAAAEAGGAEWQRKLRRHYGQTAGASDE
ncbi:MAG TPA: hypothetical protein VF116_23390 [Ktedonobacterales bacterium]